jgi:hypothetical protein
MYKVPKDKNYIEVSDFQIINGCQTVRSIDNAYKNELIKDKRKIDIFNEHCFVQVKVIRENSSILDLMNDIIISTNNQNPMTERNLKSNSHEQSKIIKTSFNNLPYKWFYQRKDGEFESLKKMPNIGNFNFRISE